MLLAEISRGSQVMEFADYLEKRCPIPVKKRGDLQEFGALLFKDGWTFAGGDSNVDFIKGSNREGKFRVVMPAKHWNPPDRTKVRYFFYKEKPPSLGHEQQTAMENRDIAVGNPHIMMDVLGRHMEASSKIELT